MSEESLTGEIGLLPSPVRAPLYIDRATGEVRQDIGDEMLKKDNLHGLLSKLFGPDEIVLSGEYVAPVDPKTGRSRTYTVVLVSEPDYQDPRWLSVRQVSIGASDVAKILDFSSYENATDVYLKKKGIAPNESTIATERGRIFESGVAEFYRRFRSNYLNPDDYFQDGNKIFPFAEAKLTKLTRFGSIAYAQPRGTNLVLSAIPDYVAELHDDENSYQILVEIKTMSGHAWRALGGKLPYEYYLQVQQQLLCTDFQYAEVALMVDNQELHIFPVDRWKSYELHFVRPLYEFWKGYLDGVVPTIAPVKAPVDWEIEKKKRELADVDDHMLNLVAQYADLKRQVAELQEIQDDISQTIKAKYGKFDGLLYKGEKIVDFRRSIKTTFDQKLFKAEHPALYQKFSYKQESDPALYLSGRFSKQNKDKE
jgi:predicted phage-related endonuclease